MAGKPPAGRRFRIIPLICASLTIALGLLTFIGWVSGLPLLASVRAKYIPMAPSTALCFSLIGIGLIKLHSTVSRYGALPAQEFFDRVIQDIPQFSQRESFDDDVCVVGMEVQRTG